MTLTAGAQEDYKWVIGGTGHFAQTRDKTAGNVSNDVVEGRIEPFVGYNINSKWRIGLTIGYMMDHTKTLDALGNLEDLGTKNTYRVGPYVHYNIVRYKRWILFAEAEAIFGYSPRFINRDPAVGGAAPGAPGTAVAAANEIKRTEFTCTIKPGITYELDKHVNIDFNLNLFGWMYANSKDTDLQTDVVTTNTRNGLNLDILEGSIENYWSQIAIGVTFKF